MNVREAARRLEISQSLCCPLCQESRLGQVRIGARGRRGKTFIAEGDLAALLGGGLDLSFPEEKAHDPRKRK